MVVTVTTHNLAYGVILGVIVAMIFFARRVAHFTEVVDVAHPDEDTCVYAVRGVLFFASSNDLVYQFDYADDPQNVIIDLSEAQIYDSSTVAALDAIVLKYHNKGKHVEIVGMNEPSAKWHDAQRQPRRRSLTWPHDPTRTMTVGSRRGVRRIATRTADEQMHQIGEVAEAVGLSLRTIRYYEEAGLVPPSGRSTGGFRLYTDADIDRLRLVKHMKPLDLTIDEMRDLLVTRDRLAHPATGHRQRCGLAKRLSVVAALVAERESFERAAESPWGSSLVSQAAR